MPLHFLYLKEARLALAKGFLLFVAVPAVFDTFTPLNLINIMDPNPLYLCYRKEADQSDDDDDSSSEEEKKEVEEVKQPAEEEKKVKEEDLERERKQREIIMKQ